MCLGNGLARIIGCGSKRSLEQDRAVDEAVHLGREDYACRKTGSTISGYQSAPAVICEASGFPEARQPKPEWRIGERYSRTREISSRVKQIRSQHEFSVSPNGVNTTRLRSGALDRIAARTLAKAWAVTHCGRGFSCLFAHSTLRATCYRPDG